MSKNKTRTKDKYRVVYNDTQRIELENEFRVNEYISIPRKQEIANKLKLSERQIKIWFQNRRAKKRKQDKRKFSDKIPQKSIVKFENHHSHHTPNNNNNNNTTNTSSSISPLNHYSDCHLEQQQHQSTLAAPQETLIKDSRSPPAVLTNQSNTNVKVHLSLDDNSTYPQAHQDVSIRHSPQHQNQQQQQHLHQMTCFGSSPITMARSLPDIPIVRGSTSLTTMGPSYIDHQLPPTNNYNYDYDTNSNIVQTSNSPNYCSDNNNAPQIDLASCQQSAAAAQYNNYPPAIHNMNHPNQTTPTTSNYYPTVTNHNHHCSTTLLNHTNRASSTSIAPQQSTKVLNCDSEFLGEPKVNNGLPRSTEASYDLTPSFGYDLYETRNPLSQYVDPTVAGSGPQRKLRSCSYNNLGSINSHHQAPAQLYTQQPQPTGEHMFVSRQQFYY